MHLWPKSVPPCFRHRVARELGGHRGGELGGAVRALRVQPEKERRHRLKRRIGDGVRRGGGKTDDVLEARSEREADRRAHRASVACHRELTAPRRRVQPA
eukprot:scaffold125380_cov57-Phaeocystis_antarctica.AAC.6